MYQSLEFRENSSYILRLSGIENFLKTDLVRKTPISLTNYSRTDGHDVCNAQPETVLASAIQTKKFKSLILI